MSRTIINGRVLFPAPLPGLNPCTCANLVRIPGDARWFNLNLGERIALPIVPVAPRGCTPPGNTPVYSTSIVFRNPSDLDTLSFYTAGEFVGDNSGFLTFTPTGSSLNVSATPLRYNAASGDSTLDHVKYLEVTDPIPVGPTQTAVFNLRAASTLIQPASIPPYITNPNDFRIGSGAMNFLANDFIVADIIIGNDTIYALYERLPFGWTSTSSYSAFTALYPLIGTSPGQFHNLSIVLNNQTGTLTWSADGVSTSINMIGAQPNKSYGGQVFNTQFQTIAELNPPFPVSLATDLVPITSFQAGVGIFTLMDFAPYVPGGPNANASSPGYIQLAGIPYAKPTSWLFTGSLPFSTPVAPFSNDPNITTVYGQSVTLSLDTMCISVSQP